MHTATAVDGYWLAELGPMFFSVKVNSLPRTWKTCSKYLISRLRGTDHRTGRRL